MNSKRIKAIIISGAITAAPLLGGLQFVRAQESFDVGVASHEGSHAHAEGTLINRNGTFFVIKGGTRFGFPTAEILASHGYKLSDAVVANNGDMALPQGANATFAPGTLVNSGGTVYIVTGSFGDLTTMNTVRGFPNATIFTNLGYSFSNVLRGNLVGYPVGANVSATTEHPSTSFVNVDGTIYTATQEGSAIVKRPFASFDVFCSWGLRFNRAVVAESGDRVLATGSFVPSRENGDSPDCK